MLPFLASSFSPTRTPSTTFHHLLSGGTFQPVRSLPLKIEGRSSFASAALITRTEERTSNNATQNHFIKSPGIIRLRLCCSHIPRKRRPLWLPLDRRRECRRDI